MARACLAQYPNGGRVEDLPEASILIEQIKMRHCARIQDPAEEPPWFGAREQPVGAFPEAVKTSLPYNVALLGPSGASMKSSFSHILKVHSRDVKTVPVANKEWLGNVTRRWGQGSLLLALLMALAACKKKPQETNDAVGVENKQSDELESVMLEVNGFNYTDLYIDHFNVGGVGGGNVSVSSPESGGGGSTCCLRWYPGVTLPFPIDVEWTRDRKRWCEKQVMITGPVPAHPKHLVVQFFQDGRIEVELTEKSPDVKFRLERFSRTERKQSGNTVLDEQIARCHDAFSQ